MEEKRLKSNPDAKFLANFGLLCHFGGPNRFDSAFLGLGALIRHFSKFCCRMETLNRMIGS
jgi:hypothetical protein